METEELLALLQEGNILHFHTPDTNLYFAIGQTKMYGIWWTTVYKILADVTDVKPVKGYKNKVIDTRTMKDWLSNLVFDGTHADYVTKAYARIMGDKQTGWWK
jgi:hypothetical protein